MQQNMAVTDIGTIVMRAAGKEYVCSSLSLSMRLNSLPTATVVIGWGTSLRNGATDSRDNNAEDLLAMTMKQTNSSSDGFINCEIWEIGGPKDVCIFKGCIISASLVYKTGNNTIRAVRIECMNAACRLYSQPFSSYYNRCGSDTVNTALGLEAKAEAGPSAVSTYGMYALSNLTELQVLFALGERTQNKDIATKIAYIADAMAILTTRVVDTVNPIKETELGSILKINKYIKSDYKLNYKQLAINNQTDTNYDYRLCSIMLSSLQNASVFDTILRTMTSTEFMLSLVPTWSDQGFMMKLVPSKAWDTAKPEQIYFSDIAEMNSTYSPLQHINDPEVFVANLTPAYGFGDGNKTSGSPSTSPLVGVFSTNSQVARWLKMRFSAHKLETKLRDQLVATTAHFKWKEYMAPAWLYSCIVRDTQDSKNKDNGIPSNVTSQRTSLKQGSTAKTIPFTRDYIEGAQIADRIAQALYVHLHGASATAQLTLLPDLRFGMLTDTPIESRIGELIDIIPTEDAKDKQLAMRGVLEGIQFTYNAGQSASCNYTMYLSRVRPLDYSEPRIVCPLYVRASSK